MDTLARVIDLVGGPADLVSLEGCGEALGHRLEMRAERLDD